MIFAGIFQYFYLRLAIFFGCLGMFMYLFTGEMSNRTLHYWFLAPAPRDRPVAWRSSSILKFSFPAGVGGETAHSRWKRKYLEGLRPSKPPARMIHNFQITKAFH